MFDYIAFKEYIDKAGLKQRAVAQKAEMTEAMLSAIVNGRAKCSLENYVNICKALKVKFGTFINDDFVPAN